MRMENHIADLKRQGFLTRLRQLSGGDPGRRLNAGEIGADLGLPLEQTLSIVEALHEEGALHRCGKLDPPDGPEVHLTARGIRSAADA